MVNEENDCHSQLFKLLFSNHFKTMMLKKKVDIHVFSASEKIFFDMLPLENIISDIERNVSNKQEKIGVNPYIGYVRFCMKLYVSP